MDYTLEFERPVTELENQIKELKAASLGPGVNLDREIRALEKKVERLIEDTYGHLSTWDRVLLARHPLRPHSVDFIEALIRDFHELHGDRRSGDDRTMITGLGFLGNQKVAVIAQEKGRQTKEKIEHNFGMARPEGYRKALRIMKLAEQFRIPIVCLIDTPGAYPGIEAEERGQAEAIATNLAEMVTLRVPIIAVVIGEGGSGGALGIAVADCVAMMEYAIYSVISPESCASILWSDPRMANAAANALKMDATQALSLNVIDAVIAEPPGGAQRHPELAMSQVGDYLRREIEQLMAVDGERLVERRYMKYREMGNQTLSDSNAKDSV